MAAGGAAALLEPDPEEEAPLSCADLTLLEEQSLLINAQVAAVAAQLVYDLVVKRTVHQYAVHFNLEPPTMSSLVLTPTNLARFQRPSTQKEKNNSWAIE
jgi:hypothetical protein